MPFKDTKEGVELYNFDNIKSFIHTLITRAKEEERAKLLSELQTYADTHELEEVRQALEVITSKQVK